MDRDISHLDAKNLFPVVIRLLSRRSNQSETRSIVRLLVKQLLANAPPPIEIAATITLDRSVRPHHYASSRPIASCVTT
jgi:hypothetical protein